MTKLTRFFPFDEPLVLLTLIFALVSYRALAQQPSTDLEEEEQTRMLWNTTFIEKRPAAKKAGTVSGGGPAPQSRKPAPASKTQSASQTSDIGDALVGVTIWSLREPESSDDPSASIRSLSGGEQWTPIRVEADTPLSEGEKIRVSFEAVRTGYLYVIDREQYADGTFGPPSLIFPTLQTHNGNNEVSPGRLIEIPALDDDPPYFTMQANRPDQVAELLTVIVAPEPLPGVKIGLEPLPVSPVQVRAWEQQWGVQVKRLEARGQAGKPYTKAEKEAGLERTRLLAHEEPLPQTMYHLDAMPSAPLLFSIPLRIAR